MQTCNTNYNFAMQQKIVYHIFLLFSLFFFIIYEDFIITQKLSARSILYKTNPEVLRLYFQKDPFIFSNTL